MRNMRKRMEKCGKQGCGIPELENRVTHFDVIKPI